MFWTFFVLFAFEIFAIAVTHMAHQALAIEEIPLKKHKGGYMQINKALDLSSFQDYLEAQLSHLPAIADVERISPRVIRVLGQNAGMVTGPICHGQELRLTEDSSRFKGPTLTLLGLVGTGF